MVYRLDLRTLLHMLSQSTGTLQADLQRVPGIKKHSQVHLTLVKGLIVASSIVDDQGKVLLSDKAAIKLVEALILDWNYTAALPPAIVPQAPPPPQQHSFTNASSIVRRSIEIDRRVFRSWPRLHRNIYFLTSQPISIKQIIALLRNDQAPERVVEALSDLLASGVVVLTEPEYLT